MNSVHRYLFYHSTHDIYEYYEVVLVKELWSIGSEISSKNDCQVVEDW